MNTFVSFAEEFKIILCSIIQSDTLHLKWLNTLSYLENCGARKIAACEHPILVKEEMLKHAAEEFRHAYHMKRQMMKLSGKSFPNYALDFLLGGFNTLHYLDALEIEISRYLKKEQVFNGRLKESAYLLITYAIELRARDLYTLYDQFLTQAGSKISIKSILFEEQGHLEEMEKALNKIPFSLKWADQAILLESKICQKWLSVLKQSL